MLLDHVNLNELIRRRKYEEAAEIARAQVKRGAHVIDICLADPDRDEIGRYEGIRARSSRKSKSSTCDRFNR